MTIYWKLLVILLLTSCQRTLPHDVSEAMSNLPERLDFNNHVKPILSDRCFACHGPDQKSLKAGLRLDLAEHAFGELPENPGHFAIVKGNPNKSTLVDRILSDDGELLMPPSESTLTLNSREKAILIKWIEQGAEYKKHWAFIKPNSPTPPATDHQDLVQNEIDLFVFSKLVENDMVPQPVADPELLLRRLSFDIRGLPPSIEEMDDFSKNPTPANYEKMVDLFIKSNHYGERMATDWLDLARYADTHGYTVDRYRDMSPYRDWVIDAFNDNIPYDDFVTWQLAGDLLENPTKSQMIATAFNRNHQQNMEGGIVPEEFRVEYVADRTNTLGTAFLGMTMECARCHDHKFDPISQKEYFELFSFFNNVNESGQISWDNATPVPTILLPSDRTDSIINALEQQIEAQENALQTIREESKTDIQSWANNFNANRYIPKKPIGIFSLDKIPIKNSVAPYQIGQMKQQGVNTPIKPQLVDTEKGKGLLLDGDAWLDLGGVGAFRRSTPFSIGLWVKIPSLLQNGVIFHKGMGAILLNFKGLHLAIKDNKLEMMMAHTAPDNAIIEYGGDIPREQWVHLMMTYDGSSRASGLRLFVDGEERETEIQIDNLYKDIKIIQQGVELGIQIGARWRGVGLKNAVVDDIVIFNKTLTPIEIRNLIDPKFLKETFTDENVRKQGSELLHEYYLTNVSKKYHKTNENLLQLRETLFATIDTLPELMVVKEMNAPRPAFVLERGAYNAPTDEVFPSTPIHILPFPEDFQKNRLGLARWLFHSENPLTARVAVNRIWQQFFGHGFVSTSNDFGSQGDTPTHPELLDWLAVEFRDSGWDIKKIVKKIVMSHTYRQSSLTNEDLTLRDPKNTLLGRGPSGRLSAEMMRDNVLSACQLLDNTIGGKSVKPYQPDGLWRINGGTYKLDEAPKIYRRSLYTFWKRTVPNPTLATFDAPDRANCTVKRQKTATPLQALVLLNDPTFLEAARVLGVEISKSSQAERAITTTFRKLTGRKPYKREIKVLLDLQKKEREKFEKHPDKMHGWLTAGVFRHSEQLQLPLLAANTVVASTIINTDATTSKR